MEWSYFGYNNEVYNTDYNPLKITPGSFFNYFARFYVDSYENRYFPTDGWFGYLEATIIPDTFLTYIGKSPVGHIQYDIESAI